MPAANAIPVDKLSRLIGTPRCPAIVDIRTDDEFAARPVLIPGAVRRPFERLSDWTGEFEGRSAILVCRTGEGRSHGAAAWLRQAGGEAETLEDGFEAWVKAGLPVVADAKLPARDASGRTRWVTRARPKIDRIACPWLIRRFVDPTAIFLFVTPAEVMGVAEQLGAAPFDIEGEGVLWSHRGDLCTFDVMVEELGLGGVEALTRLAAIVRGADTGRLDEAPEAAGLLAASLGLSRIYADDLEQLEAGMLLYDAFYRWCRDATGETHNWTSHRPSGGRS
jgi:rhodanese-related sulfurtransferase